MTVCASPVACASAQPKTGVGLDKVRPACFAERRKPSSSSAGLLPLDMASVLSSPAPDGSTAFSAVLLADSFAQVWHSVLALLQDSYRTCCLSCSPICQVASLSRCCVGIYSSHVGEAEDAFTTCQYAFDGLYPRVACCCRSYRGVTQ